MLADFSRASFSGETDKSSALSKERAPARPPHLFAINTPSGPRFSALRAYIVQYLGEIRFHEQYILLRLIQLSSI